MAKILFFLSIVSAFVSCQTNSTKNTSVTYPFKAIYSSDLSMASDPEIAQKVLTVWKMYESKQIDAMKAYYADTVTYDDANGNHYYGPSSGLLDIAKKEMDQVDSMRFDISMWESVHSNDKNEDWVNIWCKERVYPKTGKADTSLMYEQWKVKGGKVYYFNQYYAKQPKH